MNFAEWLKRSGLRRGTAPALLRGEAVAADYAGFAARASGLAASLRDRLGVAPGDRVGLFMENRPEYLVALYGIWWAGAAVLPINAKLHGREAAWILDDAEARVALVSEGSASALAEALSGRAEPRLISVDEPRFARLQEGGAAFDPAPREADDLAWLFYTSGTTGRPKGVMIPGRAILAMALSYFVDVDAVGPGDAALYAAPLSHGAGLYNFMHVRQAARHVTPPSGGFDAAEILALARRLRSVSMFAAPTMVRRLTLAAHGDEQPGQGLKTVVYGGGPMYRADIEAALRRFGPRFVQIYGQGEAPMAITALSREDHFDTEHPRFLARLASVGVAQSAVALRVAREDGTAAEPGEPGEVEARGPLVMTGYWRRPDATAETVRAGWLRTGDVGALDADGYLTLHDRSKDLIISGGTNIYPREVEEALLEHEDVAEAAVVGQPDPEWGETVVAFIAPKPGRRVDPDRLDAHCLARIARFKRPKRYVGVDALPKNNYGKVLKTELRTRLARG